MCSIGAVVGISQNLKLFFSLDLAFTQAHAANIISMVLGARHNWTVVNGLAGRPLSEKICDDADLFTHHHFYLITSIMRLPRE